MNKKINYVVAWHIRQFVKKELIDYTKNKKMLERYQGNTRELIIAYKRINQIETVLEQLNEADREAFDIIFVDQYTVVGAEIARGLGRGAYYNAMNKIIYLVAKEMELI